MKKQILLSVMVIGVVAVTTFQATKAYFTDSAKSLGSNFTVGTLDLSVGGANGTNIEPFIINNIGADNTSLSGAKTWTITNNGTLPGRLYFKLENIQNKENGCNTPEAKVDVTCDDPGVGQGELGKLITTKIYLNDQLVTTTNLADGAGTAIVEAWNRLSPTILTANQTTNVKLEWSMAPEGYGNEIQSDSLGFDVGFDLVQASAQ